MIFNFFQTGESLYPPLLIRSIRKFFPDAFIIHTTDLSSRSYEGVDRLYRHDGDSSKFMAFRIEANLHINLTEQAIFLDSDMLISRKFTLDKWEKNDAVLCLREFNNESIIKTTFRGLNLVQYKNKTFGEIWPFLGCLNIVKGSNFWLECNNKLKSVDPQMLAWYSDQEVIRDVYNEKKDQLLFDFARESLFACLPEFADINSMPFIMHFKGSQRKDLMVKLSKELFS